MPLERHEIEHKGFTIFWETPKPIGQTYPVHISTANIELRTRLGVDAYQISQSSFDDAIAMAKSVIDRMLDGIGPEEREW